MSFESLKAQPLLRQWLAIGLDDHVQVFSGKVDIGQGISHALRLIVAEELRLDPQRISMVPASTHFSPDEAVTSGSLSVQHSGTALRCAAAHLREICRQRMAQRHGLNVTSVRCADGAFWVPEQAAPTGFDALMDAGAWDSAIDPSHLKSGHAAQDLFAPPCTPPSRPDVAAKVLGEFSYIQDRVLPNMCHGLVFRPGTLMAEVIEPDLQALQNQLVSHTGVLNVVRDGLLLGVLAETESVLAQVVKTIDEGVAQGRFWRCHAEVPNPHDLPTWLQQQALDTSVVVDTTPEASFSDAVAHQVQADFQRPFLQHASIGLCCALAKWTSSQALEVWSHSQGIYNLRRDLALAFDLPAEQVHVSHAEGAGCYGHNGADDVAWDAAWLARQVPGRAVRVQWTRQAELGHAPLAPAMAVRILAQVNAAGQLMTWTQTVWSHGHGTRPGRGKTPALLGAWQTTQPQPVTLAVNAALSTGGGSERNAYPPYEVPALKVTNHRVLNMPFRVSAMRALGAPVNVLAAESVMDELAQHCGQDPLAFRLTQLQSAEHSRAKAVLEQVTAMAAWSTPALQPRPEGWGRGLAYARYKNTGAYCAVVVELLVAEKVKLQKIWIAADLGHVVDPDGAVNQIEGGALQAASWALCEAAELTPQGVASNDWSRYPILKFSDMPPVQVQLMARADQASLGAGECSCGPTCAAIANAIAQAMGVRVRRMPFTPNNLLQAIEAAS